MYQERKDINKLESADSKRKQQQQQQLATSNKNVLNNTIRQSIPSQFIETSIIIVDNVTNSVDNKIKKFDNCQSTRTCPKNLTTTTTKLLTSFTGVPSTNNNNGYNNFNNNNNVASISSNNINNTSARAFAAMRQQEQLSNRKGNIYIDNNNSIGLLDKNSFESINSKHSISSANDDSTSSSVTMSNLQQLLPIVNGTTSELVKPTSFESNYLINDHESNSLSNDFVPIISNNKIGAAPMITTSDNISSIANRKESNDNSEVAIMSVQASSKTTNDNNNKSQRSSSEKKEKNSEKYQIDLSTNNDDDDGFEDTSKGHLSKKSTQTKALEAANNNNNNKNKNNKPKPPFMFAGLLGAMLGSILFSFSFLCLKLLPEHEGFIGKMKALFFRAFFITIFSSAAIIIGKSTFKVPKDEVIVNILRAVFGTTGVLGSYISLLYIGMGEATALIFSSPIWTSILGHFILNEPLHCSHFLAVPISLIGIIFIAHPGLIIDVNNLNSLVPFPRDRAANLQFLTNDTLTNNMTSQLLYNQTHHQLPFNSGDQLIGADIALSNTDPELIADSLGDSFEHRWPGIITAILTSFFVSFSYITLKFRQKTPVQTTTFWFGMGMTIFSIICLTYTGFGEAPQSLYEWSLYFFNGILSWLGQSIFQWAFLYEEAGVLSVLRTLDVATTFILSAIFLTEDIYWTSIVGAAIIGLVVISLVLNNYIQQTSCMKSTSTFSKNIILSKNDETIKKI